MLKTKSQNSDITLIDYDQTNYLEKTIDSISECFPYHEKPTVTWINVKGLQREEDLIKLGQNYGFHHLVVEDIFHTGQRPKMEDYDNYIYIVARMIYFQDNEKNLFSSEQISIILGKNYIISFQENAEGDIFTDLRKRIKIDKNIIAKYGTDYLAYCLLDEIVDNYFTAMEKFGNRIEDLEGEILANPNPETLKKIHNLKRTIINLRQSVWPLREVINKMVVSTSPLIKDSTKIYLRDVYDHTVTIIETIEGLRDIVADMIEIYLSTIGLKTNEIIKLLTIISTIFIPLSFVIGLFSMNLKMPLYNIDFAYPIVLGAMALIAICMLLFFRKKRWI